MPATPSLPPTSLLTVEEAAQRTGVQPRLIRSAIRAGLIPHVKVTPTVTRIHPQDLENYWRVCTVKER